MTGFFLYLTILNNVAMNMYRYLFKSLLSVLLSIYPEMEQLVCVNPAKFLQSYLTLVTPWTIAHQAPLSMGFCRQEHWSGLP